MARGTIYMCLGFHARGNKMPNAQHKGLTSFPDEEGDDTGGGT